MSCLFCKIAGGEIATDFVYENEDVVAFKDINPQAPCHILIIPRQHVSSVKEVTDPAMAGKLFAAGNQVAEKLGLESYRFVINTGAEAGQTVFHLHLHLLGGRIFNWPPG